MSVDRNFRDDFFTLQQRSTIVKPGTENGTTPDPKFLSKVAELASRIWSRMENGRQGLTHSYYFKMFVNNVEQFIEDNRRELKFDIVMLDEAQDSNRATLHIFEALPGQKIMVGDPHQSIYSFRGASNLMDTFEADEELVLSTTFRFGKSIAKEANMVL